MRRVPRDIAQVGERDAQRGTKTQEREVFFFFQQQQEEE
tara:strand:- start:936 stop:1052 length:117 start_codon:yes stop_codon:yes gene_type:complete